MSERYRVEAMRRTDWAAVRAIYAEGLATGLAAFMAAPPRWASWNGKYLANARFVARDARAVIGWAALTLAADT
ncbi:MAG: hypothetical protein R3D31_08935 [Hyphomicrobiaceae bacterium]